MSGSPEPSQVWLGLGLSVMGKHVTKISNIVTLRQPGSPGNRGLLPNSSQVAENNEASAY